MSRVSLLWAAVFLVAGLVVSAWWRQSIYRHASVEEEYESSAAKYDNTWKVYTNITISESLSRSLPTLEALPCQPTCTVLDVGCGTGALAYALKSHFPRWSVTCSDLSAEMLKQAQSARQLDTVMASSESLPFSSNVFDVVVTASSFHFWSNHTAAVCGEITRVLRPGGIFLLADWSHDFLSCQLCSLYLRLVGHPRSAYTIWSLDQISLLTSSCGLTREAAFVYEVPLRPFGISFFPRWGMMTLLTRKD